MNLYLQKSKIINQQLLIKVTGSKSETNRLLLLQALYPDITLENSSNSDDSEVMTAALANSQFTIHNLQLIDIYHAGTAMRFLTAFFATQEGKEVILTGSNRMKERPIKILVEALNQLGAVISYEDKEGFPPILIKGTKLKNNTISLPANISSQYISALLLIASKLENGLILTLEGQITSVPYIKMTLALLNEIGVETLFENNVITVKPLLAILNSKLIIESDWSSASYWYSIIALSKIGTVVKLSSYKPNSLQGDSALAEIYIQFGVITTFKNQEIIIKKEFDCTNNIINLDLNNCPDIAQTIAVCCFGLGIACQLTGLHTLKIKETDRLEALKNELSKLGANILVTNQSLILDKRLKIIPNVVIKTYQDHRMAMAFAPLALITDLIIENAEVVSKSYPTFWEDLKSVGFLIKKL